MRVNNSIFSSCIHCNNYTHVSERYAKIGASGMQRDTNLIFMLDFANLWCRYGRVPFHFVCFIVHISLFFSFLKIFEIFTVAAKLVDIELSTFGHTTFSGLSTFLFPVLLF
jgi:hypothetical protein